MEKTIDKLNSRRTFLIALAFFGILMLWQIHYFYSPLYLNALLGEGDNNYIIGIIMSLNNFFAIFMIPLFGWLSDKTKTRFGRRMPYIIAGSVLAFILFPLMAVAAILNSLAWFIILMVLMIIAMTVYRSPAVALMPDITPKPLRPQANAIINLVGYIGAIIAALMTMLFVFDTNPTLTIVPFIITGLFLMFALTMLLVRFRENKVVEEMREQLLLGEKQAETVELIEEDKPLRGRDKLNLFIIMGAVFMAFFAFAALNKFGSLYGTEVLGTSNWGLAMAVLAIASLITFIPSVKLTKLIGRKNSIIAGLILIIIVMLIAGFVQTFGPLLIVLFAISGIGWAIVNVNTYPMVVEMASRKNVGKYTGIYYVASQVAQALTSIVVGFVFDWLGLEVYFFYAVIFMSLALILCFFFKTNTNRLPKTNV